MLFKVDMFGNRENYFHRHKTCNNMDPRFIKFSRFSFLFYARFCFGGRECERNVAARNMVCITLEIFF